MVLLRATRGDEELDFWRDTIEVSAYPPDKVFVEVGKISDYNFYARLEYVPEKSLGSSNIPSWYSREWRFESLMQALEFGSRYPSKFGSKIYKKRAGVRTFRRKVKDLVRGSKYNFKIEAY